MNTRILVVALGPVGTRMAAPGIRSFNVARVLQKEVPGARVTLAVPPGDRSDVESWNLPFTIARAAGNDIARLAMSHDIIVSGSFTAALIPLAARKKMVLDMYSPLITEWASMSRFFGKRHRRAVMDAKRRHLTMELTAADLVLCANERQRDFVAGIMGTLGMITPRQFETDHTLEQRIAIAPLGIRPHEPVQRSRVLRGIREGFNEHDLILLWNGTIVEWYDVMSLLKAMRILADERDDVKLLFLGTNYPQPKAGVEERNMGAGIVRDAVAFASEQGLLDRHVFFNPGWADDATTEQCLLEADLGVATYFDNLETHFSFRVRYLDLLWASLPIVCTRGDVVAELVDKHGLGATVEAHDPEGLAAAIRRLADPGVRARCREQLAVVREEFRWERTLAPLIEFCRAPVVDAAEKRARMLPLAWRGAEWFAAEAHEKLRFAYRKQLLGIGHSGLK